MRSAHEVNKQPFLTSVMEEDNAMRYQKTAVVRMGLVKSAEEAWQLFNQNFPHYVKAWKPSGSTLNSSAQTEGNGVEVRAKYERETKTITRMVNSNRTVARITKAVYTCTALNAPHDCTFEYTESTFNNGKIVIVLGDQPSMLIHFVHEPSKSADGGFDLAITFASSGTVQPLLCKILCIPCMLTGCIDMDRVNRAAVESKANHMKQQAQEIINGGPRSMNDAALTVAVQPGGKSLGEKIKEISELKDQGVLSEEEFSAAKAKLIAEN